MIASTPVVRDAEDLFVASGVLTCVIGVVVFFAFFWPWCSHAFCFLFAVVRHLVLIRWMAMHRRCRCATRRRLMRAMTLSRAASGSSVDRHRPTGQIGEAGAPRSSAPAAAARSAAPVASPAMVATSRVPVGVARTMTAARRAVTTEPGLA